MAHIIFRQSQEVVCFNYSLIENGAKIVKFWTKAKNSKTENATKWEWELYIKKNNFI